MDGQSAPPPFDARIATLAGDQHGVVAWRDLIELGLRRGAIEGRLRRGSLQRVHRGVYADSVLARNPGRRGARTLQTILGSLHHEPQLTRSELEGFFVDLCDDHDVPRPAINQIVEGFEVDFVWRRHKLIVEADGRQTHATPAAFERDRARDAALTVAGYRVVRFTYRQIVREPAAVARTVLSLLGDAVLGSS